MSQGRRALTLQEERLREHTATMDTMAEESRALQVCPATSLLPVHVRTSLQT